MTTESKGDVNTLMKAIRGSRQSFYQSVKDIRALLKGGVSPNVRSSEGLTALMVAISCGTPEVVREILAHGANVNDETSEGWTALMLAALGNNITVINHLIERGANPHHKNTHGKSAVELAYENGYIAGAKVLEGV